MKTLPAGHRFSGCSFILFDGNDWVLNGMEVLPWVRTVRLEAPIDDLLNITDSVRLLINDIPVEAFIERIEMDGGHWRIEGWIQ
jgi:hypothetical protein